MQQWNFIGVKSYNRVRNLKHETKLVFITKFIAKSNLGPRWMHVFWISLLSPMFDCDCQIFFILA